MDTKDRELLELAAKAAGITGADDGSYSDLGVLIPSHLNTPRSSHYGVWNPLNDDGDALRLASRLHLCVCHTLGGIVGAPGTVMVGLNMWENNAPLVVEWYSGPGDAGEAVRRAITRAAAEIGRAMP